mmetsp:Transcript_19292/g.44930  ORF Transcript_19292/g.44930 Transcript_19292/m.44930 type:complete len:233 (+) Transcript_19292:481-1179(+)
MASRVFHAGSVLPRPRPLARAACGASEKPRLLFSELGFVRRSRIELPSRWFLSRSSDGRSEILFIPASIGAAIAVPVPDGGADPSLSPSLPVVIQAGSVRPRPRPRPIGAGVLFWLAVGALCCVRSSLGAFVFPAGARDGCFCAGGSETLASLVRSIKLFETWTALFPSVMSMTCLGPPAAPGFVIQAGKVLLRPLPRPRDCPAFAIELSREMSPRCRANGLPGPSWGKLED